MRRHRLRVDETSMNLVPLLDMISMLIQMLLVNAQFGVYAELRSNVAAGTTEALGEELGLTVRVQPDGYAVQWLSGGNTIERSVPCAAPCPAEGYDVVALRQILAELHDQRPDESAIVLLPAAGVSFEAVVRTMDAVREDDRGKPLFPELVVGP